MGEQARPQKATVVVIVVLMVSMACFAAIRLFNLSSSKSPSFHVPADLAQDLPKPDLSTLAPGAWTAIRNAIGDDGLSRVTNIISPSDGGFPNSQHGQSGVYNGHPYGLAFDISVNGDVQGVEEARALRLQGVAAWYREASGIGFGNGGMAHLHCVWPGAQTNNPVNLQQISSFVHGYLAQASNSSRSQGWKDPSIRPDEIACVTRAYYSVPGRKPLDKIVTYDALHASKPAILPNLHPSKTVIR